MLFPLPGFENWTVYPVTSIWWNWED